MKIRAIVSGIAVSLCGFSQSIVYNPSPLREFGQPRLNPAPTANPNLVEGRELYGPQSIAIDTSTNPPILYVSDTGNNRILAWKDATAFTKGNFADFVIGQNDMMSTSPNGTGAPGLSGPGALAVDRNGNLYVVDTLNNRILRYPSPAAHTDFEVPDLVIGQASLSSGNQPNEGRAAPTAKTIATTSGNAANTSGLAFDAQGNLWFADTFNNRVLRYNVNSLTAGNNEPAADLVLGQNDFTSNKAVANNNPLDKTGFTQPQSIAFSRSGELYVGDALGPANGLGRILYFRGPFVRGMPTNAIRILGLYLFPQGSQPALNATTMAPVGLTVLGDNLYVADQSAHRIMKFDAPSNWPPECIPSQTNTNCGPNGISPPAIQFVGQVDSLGSLPNQGRKEPSATTLAFPSAVAFAGSEMYVVDSGNSRVLAFPQTAGSNAAATRVAGQLDLTYGAPNLIEGRELYIWSSNYLGGGLAVDASSNPPHLYIADTLNNRVLGFRDLHSLAAGGKADIVIGQSDFYRNAPNYANPSLTAVAPTDLTLYRPVAVAVDKNGDLYVADTENGRVLRFPQPFNQAPPIRANLVLGKPGFFTNPSDANFASASTMARPSGLAFTNEGNLLVSDAALNRVLLFVRSSNGDFTNVASRVLGQPNMTSSAPSNAPDGLSGPQGLAVDSSNRIYVADRGNNRINAFSSDFVSRFQRSFSSPWGVAVNSAGEVWVTDSNRVVRFPEFLTWQGGAGEISSVSTVGIPIAIALDPSGNPIVSESINRVSFYYIAANFQNGASYASRALSPGMIAYLSRGCPLFLPTCPIVPDGGQAVATSQPWPTTLADTQVWFNGQPAPIYYVYPDRVAFQVPNGAPSAGSADVQLVRASTGEILAAAAFAMHSADPAFFTLNGAGFGQIAALNQDGSVNGPSNPAGRDTIISLFGTGIGHIDGAPPDGVGAPGPLSPAGIPRVSFNPGGVANDSDIRYWGLAPGLPGVWQMNLHIPNSVPPGAAVQVAFFWNDYASNDGPTGKVTTTIAVK
jgi:uncharacterized protein (TIGR03437 family)